MRKTSTARLGLLALAASFAPTSAVHAQSGAAIADPRRPSADTARDAARHPAEMLALAQVAPGQTVVELIPGHGYFTRLFADAVKPGGHVIVEVPTLAADHDPEGVAIVNAIAADRAYGNISVVSHFTDPSVHDVDLVFTAQNYHDLYNVLPPEGIAAFNRAVFAALKPGGLFVIVDHATAPGAGTSATKTLHRIDPKTIKAAVLAAGFVFDGTSDALRNPADPHTAIVFDPSIRGHTDQFAFRFRKPR